MKSIAQDTMHDRPLIGVTIPAPADRVWRMLREPSLIREWFGWDADTLAAEIEHIFFLHGKSSDAEKILRFEGIGDRFEVESHGDESILRVIRQAPTADMDWDEEFDEMVQGWISFVQQLRFAEERHPGDTRRTLHFSGWPVASGGTLATHALGLPAAGVPGSPCPVQLAPDEWIPGRLWHRGKHQIGVEVEAWGDGLLIVMDRPKTTERPHGGSQLILTTYDLSEEAFEALRMRWTSWWDRRFETRPLQEGGG